MSILYCQKTILPNSSAHALHTGSTAAHFAETGVPTFFFPALPFADGKACLENYFHSLGFSTIPDKLHPEAVPVRQKGLYSLLFRYKLLHAMFREHHPLCFASSVKEAIIALRLRKYVPGRKKIPVVFEIHHLISRLKKGSEAERLFALESKAFHEADLIVFNCEALQEQARNYLPAPKQAVVSPLGFNEKVILPLRDPSLPEPGEARSQVLLVYVGSFQEGKGTEHLIRSLKALPEHYILRLIGGRPEEALRHMQKIAADSGVSHRVQFLGQVAQNEVSRHMSDADIFVIPLETETDFLAPMKMFEAIGFALPIVATPMPSLTAQLADGVNAFFSTATEPDDLAEAILHLGEDPHLRKKMRSDNIALGKTLSNAGRAALLLDVFSGLFGQNILT